MSNFQRVEMVMGTAAVIDIRNTDRDEDAIERVFDAVTARLHEIDKTFTTYDAASEISRIGRGELALTDATDDVRYILDLCQTLHDTTKGYFDIYKAATTWPAAELQATTNPSARPIEPSGVVKGWAVEQACDILRREGLHNFCVGIGGDLYASGEYEPGQGWRIGLQHPFEKMKVMAVIEIRDTAVATSALYERGEHIVRPALPEDQSLVSMSVVGPDITLADSYATAAFAMGVEGMVWLSELPGFEVFAVDSKNMTHFSPGLAALRV